MPNNSPDRDPTESPAVVVVAHPPERRQRRKGRTVLLASMPGNCCCCCCCCLHSVGGLIGAGVAPRLWRSSKVNDDAPPDGRSAVSLFWWIFVTLTLCTSIVSVALQKYLHPRRVTGELFILPILLLALGLPVLQLVAAGGTAALLAVSGRSDKAQQFALLGKLVLGVFLGTMLGLVFTVLVGVVLK